MKTTSTLMVLLVGCLMIPNVATATERSDEFQFEFTYHLDGLTPVDIVDNSVMWFPLTQTMLTVDASSPMVYLELEIDGLSHQAPMDLDVILLDPYGVATDITGAGLRIMEDAGRFGAGFELINTNLLFADKGLPIPHSELDGPLQPWPDTIYHPDGPPPGGFSSFYGNAVGTAPWFLVVIDDAAGDTGSFDSVTLRGAVPEPMSLTLLALGAVATLRRRRR